MPVLAIAWGPAFFLRLVEQASEDLLREHYIDLKDRPFFPGLVKYMHSGPVVAMVSAPCWGVQSQG